MKRSLKSILLLCALVLCVGGYLLVSRQADKAATAATEKQESPPLNTHPVEELSALSWTADGGVIRFIRDDSGWHYDADSAFPADEATLNSLADQLAALTADRCIDNVTDFSYYGLSEPGFTLTAEWSDGTSVQYGLGDATAFADGYYVNRSDDDKVYIVSTALDTTFGKSLNSLAVKEAIPQAEHVTRVTTGSVDAVYEETSRTINSDQHWYTPDGNALSNDAVVSLTDAIQSLAWGDLVTGSATDSELDAWKLSAEAEKICLYDGETEAVAFLIGTAGEDGDYYARLPGSGMVYTITADSLTEILSATHETMSAGSVLLTLPYEEIATATLTAGDTSCALQTIDQRPAASDSGEDGEETEPVTDPTADDEAVWKQLLTVTPTGTAAAREGGEVLQVSVTNRNGKSACLTVREYDADSYQASLDDGEAYTVAAENVDRLVRLIKQMH